MKDNKVYIHAIEYYLPGEPIYNDFYTQYLGIENEWIDFFIGNQARYFSYDFQTKRAFSNLQKNLELVTNRIFELSHINPQQIDAIILATATPDYLMPATVNMIASYLGLREIETYQVQSGCVGAVQAINLASILLTKFNNILVLGGDCCNKFILDDLRNLEKDEIINYILFGDGVGGFVLSTNPNNALFHLKDIEYQFTGNNVDSGQIVNWYGSADPNNEFAVKENYKLIQNHVPLMTEFVLNNLLQKHHYQKNDLSHILLPQLSHYMTTEIRKRLEIPNEKSIDPVRDISNIGNAMPFVQLKLLSKAQAVGDIAALITIESSKWLTGTMLVEKI